MYICNDNDVNIFTNMQSGWNSRKTFTFNTAGDFTAPGLINNYKLQVGGTFDANDIRTSNGFWVFNAAVTNTPTTNHGALLGIGSVGTPCQFFFPDASYYVYKRQYSSSAWTSWTKIYAGYADSAGTCTGNAATASSVAWSGITSKPTQWDASTAATLSSGLPTPRSTGHAYLCGNGVFISGPYTSNDCGWIRCTSSSESDFVLEIATGDDGGAGESIVCRQYNTSNAIAHDITLMDHSGYSTFIRAYGAVWNDYAEYRKADILTPGICVTETDNGQMTKTTERLQPGCKIISDTFGFAIGKTEEAQTPIAVCGRVLAFPYQDKNKYKLGAAVCSAPNGTVDVMTREEIMMYPERILGTVSEIPDYNIWYAGGINEQGGGGDPIPVKGRIWIYVK